MKIISQQVLSWYYENKRDLPWRTTNDPYNIWLSEIMLQQTQVDTVIPYYNKWIEKFPTLRQVANSNLDDVLKMWEGLGYYSRGRNFHKSALIIENQHNGIIPLTYDEFKSLPGVGAYTANMVLSIVSKEPRIAMDGNIRRIGFRLLGLKRQTPYNIKRLELWFNKGISKNRPGDFNQALMDLGSSICKAKMVRCDQCPISKICVAFASGSPLDYPCITKKKKTPHYTVATGLIWQEDSFYIQKRAENGHLGGLWEFPGGKIEKNESEIDTVKRKIREECQFEINPEKKIGTIKHVYSHFSISMSLYHCLPIEDIPVKNNGQMRWIKPAEISKYAFPKANHKLFHLLKNQNWNRNV
ncbi:MAG: A/G-specific adenine glycosylase [Candidatus Marinimicrobia bacterium]|nr:A/G-specific adenine glycosylase [Candidatus Neomarinimicrobiota bacterium]